MASDFQTAPTTSNFYWEIAPTVLPRVGFGAQVWYHCRISPPRFLAECRKRQLNQGSFVVLYFNFSALSDLYLVFACLFSCTALSVSISQVIGCEDRLRNDLYCVGWGVKLCSTSTSSPHCISFFCLLVVVSQCQRQRYCISTDFLPIF